ncbi:IS21 family transposase [Deferribacter abyssi]|uniref:IS21 family transposase n=1 Tax=Deferribacter abyssi TaxID=213806 RepID=UPI003C17DF87
MKRLAMSMVKDVLRLRFQNKLSYRAISRSLGVPKSTVLDYCTRFQITGLSIEEGLKLLDNELEDKLFPERKAKSRNNRPLPDFAYIAEEIRKKGVTWLLLWQEYKERHPEGYNYTQFKKYCQDYIQRLSPTMRQIYHAGETMFVDYSGLTMNMVDASTGEEKAVQIFVAVLGASGAVFVHATPNQKQSSFILSHTLAFEYFGGVPRQIIPDNLKSAVIKNTRKTLELNSSYLDMARYYNTVIIPARPNHPKDKAKVEQAVQGIQRWILAKLRNRVFYGVEEINAAIKPLMEQYNEKKIRGIGKSRFELLEELERQELLPLPKKRYQYREHLLRMVHLDYHVEVAGNYYSVPYQYIKSKVDVWYSNTTVEIFFKGKLISVHPRLFIKGQASTLDEHMPPNHVLSKERWSPKRIFFWASKIGLNTTKLMKMIMESRNHPVNAYRTCIAILKLSDEYSAKELELSCQKAISIGAFTVKSVKTILKTKSYQQRPKKDITPLNKHENIRGKQYYKEEKEEK